MKRLKLFENLVRLTPEQLLTSLRNADHVTPPDVGTDETVSDLRSRATDRLEKATDNPPRSARSGSARND